MKDFLKEIWSYDYFEVLVSEWDVHGLNQVKTKLEIQKFYLDRENRTVYAYYLMVWLKNYLEVSMVLE
jgi:hypothetical protein